MKEDDSKIEKVSESPTQINFLQFIFFFFLLGVVDTVISSSRVVGVVICVPNSRLLVCQPE